MRLQLLFVAALAALASGQKDPHWVGGRTTIVQLFEWKFSDIAAECERFLGPKGFAGVQTSPVNEYIQLASNNPPRPWWERYQPLSYKIISRSGNEVEFADMVKRCNNVGVRVYIDVAINHMVGIANPVGYGGSTADPENKNYPAVPYTSDDFHSTCIVDNYQNASNVRNCEIVQGFNDLDQSKDHVRQKIIKFLNSLAGYGIAGFRVDLAKNMWPADLEYIFSQVNNLNTQFFPGNSRAFVYQECNDLDDTQAVHPTDYTSFGVVTEFKVGEALTRLFQGKDPLSLLKNWGTAWSLVDSDSALAFIDNHDTQRDGTSVLTYKSPKLYKMATAFMLASPYGVPRLISSYDFNDYNTGPPSSDDGSILDVTINSNNTCGNGWVCEHRWRQISNMVGFRNSVVGTQVTNWWDNGNQLIAFSRGNAGFIAFNDQNGTDFKETLQTGLPHGTYCDLISGSKYNGKCSGKTVTVNFDGTAYIQILHDEEDGMLAISKDSKLNEVCHEELKLHQLFKNLFFWKLNI